MATTPRECEPLPDPAGLRAGMRASLPLLPIVAPFGLIFGAVATETGFDPVQMLAMAGLVVAGASQLAALQLIGDGAPYLVILATAAAVNLRMAMYSASLVPHFRGIPAGWRALAAFTLHDQVYALSIARFRARPDEGPGMRLGFYLGAALPIFVVWMGATVAGWLVGGQVPESWGLGIIVPLAFLSLAAPMIRGRPSLLAALTAVVVAVALRDLPFRAGLLVAAAAGIAAGLLAETLDARRAAAEERR